MSNKPGTPPTPVASAIKYPLEDASNTTTIGTSGVLTSVNKRKVTFGKYKGLEVCDVVVDDPRYILWAAENVEFFSEIFSPRDLAAAKYISTGVAELNVLNSNARFRKQFENRDEAAQEGSIAESRSHFDNPKNGDLF